MWIGGSIDVKRVDDCLDVLTAAFRSPRWKKLPQQERIRLVGRLSHIMEIAERRDLEE
jgi:acyl-CoA reductase-like NAD-dependent aldehyde dehydrogenase